ncbi:MAG: hypothetical protein BWY63_01936 [Chloroflexi bacterium ADurb.Bin360]|nr:MAG: hypothetical protein BWY63_01936 [Chloroflexi bacterium ADurb.Bin360]
MTGFSTDEAGIRGDGGLDILQAVFQLVFKLLGQGLHQSLPQLGDFFTQIIFGFAAVCGDYK